MKPGTICLVTLLLAGCSKNIETTEAVKQGVIQDIAKKVDVHNMDVNVDSVSFRGKEADANVSFRPKGGPVSQSITMSYALERVGDEWHVKSRNLQSHEQSVAPQGSQPGAVALPPGHPATSGGQQQLPPGHPAIQ